MVVGEFAEFLGHYPAQPGTLSTHHFTARWMPSSYETVAFQPSSRRAFSAEKKHRLPISQTLYRVTRGGLFLPVRWPKTSIQNAAW
jgi:hypothetical protein